jgi:hypothetical protein
MRQSYAGCGPRIPAIPTPIHGRIIAAIRLSGLLLARVGQACGRAACGARCAVKLSRRYRTDYGDARCHTFLVD